jgi:ABC-type Zn uptake system ZnuABC Zn-binding protein ZnuA
VVIAPVSAEGKERGSAVIRSAPALNVVTSTTDLYDIARAVGGARVAVVHISEGYQDPHFVDPKPSFILRLRKADVFAFVGLDLEIGWMNLLLDGAKNARIRPGGQGYLDVSQVIPVLDVARGNVDRSQGDVHPLGNPHYWLDPANGKVIAYQILLALRAVDNKNAAAYDANYKRFSAEIDRRLAGWRQAMAPFRGKPVVAYHAEWVYFYDRFGLRPFGYLEPKPGIPPSGSHVNNLIARMKGAKIQGVILPSIYATRFAEMVARETGGDVVVVPYSVGSRGTTDYFSYIDAIVDGFRRALR